MTSKEALERLVVKTGLLNDTCTNLIDCIKCKRCILNEPCENCDDYNLVMNIKQDLEILETLISVLQKFNDEEYFDLDDRTLGMDGRITITQHETNVLKRVLKFEE